MELTKFGVWIGRALPEEEYGAAASLAQELGFGTLWLGGSPRLPKLRPMLEATDTLVIATGIVNIWQYDPVELAAEFAAIEADFPGRVLLGIGIGHPEATSEYEKPLPRHVSSSMESRVRTIRSRVSGWSSPRSGRRCSISASNGRLAPIPTSRRPRTRSSPASGWGRQRWSRQSRRWLWTPMRRRQQRRPGNTRTCI